VALRCLPYMDDVATASLEELHFEALARHRTAGPVWTAWASAMAAEVLSHRVLVDAPGCAGGFAGEAGAEGPADAEATALALLCLETPIRYGGGPR
jgi:hypothetical protein